ncbi:hypothetical protein B0J11DRAFT_506570 [Dendryphion nanum]|uniref:Uncharacterized protein n=1 Tax=Dendryphion nanum TaxID=256645 RepID=A0A9P9DUZ8_9PLEO|nr:hypothetical protein B0J11DRAFT_506570 [Dendryphion nanum]
MACQTGKVVTEATQYNNDYKTLVDEDRTTTDGLDTTTHRRGARATSEAGMPDVNGCLATKTSAWTVHGSLLQPQANGSVRRSDGWMVGWLDGLVGWAVCAKSNGFPRNSSTSVCRAIRTVIYHSRAEIGQNGFGWMLEGLRLGRKGQGSKSDDTGQGVSMSRVEPLCTGNCQHKRIWMASVREADYSRSPHGTTNIEVVESSEDVRESFLEAPASRPVRVTPTPSTATATATATTTTQHASLLSFTHSAWAPPPTHLVYIHDRHDSRFGLFRLPFAVSWIITP